MIKIKMLLMALLMLCAYTMNAQVVYTEPPVIQQSTKDITIYFNASEGATGLKGYIEDVYAHTGVITSASASSSDWKYAPTWGDNSEKYKMTRVSDNLYSLTINDIKEYYGIASTTEVIKQLAFVFRAHDNSLEGKDTGGKDIFVDVHEDGLALSLETTSSSVFSATNNKVSFTVWSTQTADIKLYVNSTEVSALNGTKLTYTHTFAQGDYVVKATVSANGQTLTDELELCCRKNSEAKNFSGTLKQGANVNDDGSVTFCLYAPNKSNAMLVGEWNDYKYTNAQMMNYQGNKYFWYTVPAGQIDLNKEYIYWFIVDDNIEVGDPYAKLVSDPWNDKWINEYSEVYPNLKEYPAKASGNFIASVFNAKADEYNWEVTDFKGPKKDDLLIYELLIRDFDRREYTEYDETTGDPIKKSTRGTIETAMQHLDYLKALGVNAIELMPIQEFSGNDSWGYNPNFYFAPDKAYGTRDMYKKFIDECHKRGMAVILDVVFNHADNHPWAKLYWNSKATPYEKPSSDNPFFNVDAPHNWSVFNDWKQENTHVQQYFCDVLKYWIETYKVDGYRFDLVKGLGATDSYTSDYDASKYNSSRIEIMKKYTDAIKAANPNAYAIYEYFVDSNEEKEMADYGGLSWNKQTHNYTNAVCAISSGSSFAGMNTSGKVGYMESHDEERLGYKVKTAKYINSKGDEKSFTLQNYLKRLGAAAAFMIMNPGAKMIWQFGELGYDISGGNGDTSDKDSPWGWIDENRSDDTFDHNNHRVGLHDSYKELLWIRRCNPDLFDVANQFNANRYSWSVSDANWSNGRFITLRNDAGTKEMVVAMNPTTSLATFNYTFGKPSGSYYINSQSFVSSKTAFDAKAGTITLQAHCYVVISNMEDATSGVEDIEEGLTETNVRIFPNPATDYINVEGNNVKSIEIYSLAGALVAAEKAETTLNVSNLAKGTYLVKVTTVDGVKVEKMIKK